MSAPFATLRAAVVGTGFMGTTHVEALRRLGVEVLGVAGSTPARAERQARALGLPTAYRSVDELVADDRVDVVHVTSPNHLHHPHALAALAAGKHVVCEKPLALTSAESAELLAAARRSDRVHAVNFNLRCYPHALETRARVRAGELGAVHAITGSYLQDWLLEDTDVNWRLDPSRGGALRAVGDIGSHWIDLVTWMTGRRVREAMADLMTLPRTRRYGSETEDGAGLLLRLEGGARATASISQVAPGRKNDLTFEIDGRRRAIAWSSQRPDELWIGRRDGPNELLVRDPALMSDDAAIAGDYPGGHAQGYPDTFKALYRAVYRAAAGGSRPDRPDYPTFDDGHEQMLVADAIAASAASGRWTPVERPADAAPPSITTTTTEDAP